MPRKPLKPCAFPGCPKLCSGRYCEEHEPVATQKRLEEQKHYNRYERDAEVVKKYDGRYRRLRELYIKAHPLCEECLRRGLTVPAQEVHHILPVKWGGKHSFDNFMALCRSCHTKKDREIGAR